MFLGTQQVSWAGFQNLHVGFGQISEVGYYNTMQKDDGRRIALKYRVVTISCICSAEQVSDILDTADSENLILMCRVADVEYQID